MERSERLNYYNSVMDRIDKLKGWEKDALVNEIILHGVLGVWDHDFDREYFKEKVEEGFKRMDR